MGRVVSDEAIIKNLRVEEYPYFFNNFAEVRDYAEFMRQKNEDAENSLRKATRTGRPLGSEAFIDKMEFQLNQLLRPRKPGSQKNWEVSLVLRWNSS